MSSIPEARERAVHEPRPSLHARGLSIAYRDVVAIDGVDLEVGPGEFVAVTGASGSGKTTLLHALAGIRRGSRTSGEVVVGDSLVTDRDRALALGVILIPQGNGLASVLTAEENCLATAIGLGIPAGEARDDVAHALADVGLADSGNHLIEELSGGQQQRVAVARALASRPRVLLADEPTSELDHANRERILRLLRAVARSGIAVVMSTHDPDAAAQADRELHLDEGRPSTRI